MLHHVDSSTHGSRKFERRAPRAPPALPPDAETSTYSCRFIRIECLSQRGSGTCRTASSALGMQRAPHHCQSLETRTTPTTATNNYMSFCRREGHGHLRPQAPPKAQPPILAQVPVLQDFDQPTGESCGRKTRSHRRGNASVDAESLRYQYSGSGVSTCSFRSHRS